MRNHRTINHQWWTRTRVDNGLQRFISDLGGPDGRNLPANHNVYRRMIPAEDRQRRKKMRRYPPPAAILRHYESMPAAWWKFGFLVEVKTKSHKYELTPEIEKRLSELYELGILSKKNISKFSALARETGVPKFQLTRWARELGFVTIGERIWTEEEIKLLDEIGYLSVYTIWKKFREHGFNRTETAIKVMRKRRLVHQASPYFSVNAVAKLFGVDSHLVRGWTVKGLLRFVLKGVRQNEASSKPRGDVRLIHKDWIYDFIVNHPHVFNIRKVDQLWFLHIVTKGAVPLSYSDDKSVRSDIQKREKPVASRKTVTVDAAETWKRIDWLTAHGVSKRAIARELGLRTQLVLGHRWVRRDKALKIENLYNRELKKSNPS